MCLRNRSCIYLSEGCIYFPVLYFPVASYSATLALNEGVDRDRVAA